MSDINIKIERIKKVLYSEVIGVDESDCTTEFRTEVEKAIFKIQGIMEGK